MEQIREGSLAEHMAVPLKFVVYPTEPGTYTVDLNDEQTYFTVAGSSKGIDISRTVFLIGFILCAIGVLVVASLLLLRRLSSY